MSGFIEPDGPSSNQRSKMTPITVVTTAPATCGYKSKLTLDVVPKTQPIAIAIFDVEVAVPVRLIADVPCNLHALRLEVATQYVGIVDPHICVPCVGIGIGQMIGPHRGATVNLAQHDDDAVALDHTKARGIAPKAFVAETKFVSIKICGDHDIVHDEVRRHVPCQRYVRRHGENSTPSSRPFSCGSSFRELTLIPPDRKLTVRTQKQADNARIRSSIPDASVSGHHETNSCVRTDLVKFRVVGSGSRSN